MVSSVCLQATHLVIYVRKRLSPLISDIMADTCALGFNGTMGNKGAVMVKFNFLDTKMLFINSHLHSGLNGVANRNKDIANIMARFVYGTAIKGQVQPKMPLPNVLIFMGDMNYRINGFKPSIVQAIAQDRYDLLLQGE